MYEAVRCRARSRIAGSRRHAPVDNKHPRTSRSHSRALGRRLARPWSIIPDQPPTASLAPCLSPCGSYARSCEALVAWRRADCGMTWEARGSSRQGGPHKRCPCHVVQLATLACPDRRILGAVRSAGCLPERSYGSSVPRDSNLPARKRRALSCRSMSIRRRRGGRREGRRDGEQWVCACTPVTRQAGLQRMHDFPASEDVEGVGDA